MRGPEGITIPDGHVFAPVAVTLASDGETYVGPAMFPVVEVSAGKGAGVFVSHGNGVAVAANPVDGYYATCLLGIGVEVEA